MMAYNARTAGRTQALMIAYAKAHLDKDVCDKVLRSNKMATTGMYIYFILLLAGIYALLFNLGKIPMDIFLGLLLFAFVSPALYYLLYFTTFGRAWNKYVRWYTRTDRTTPFSFDDMSDTVV